MSSQRFKPTPEQQAVIDHDGSAFVTACPGAGKTRVMTERARRLFGDMPSGQGVAFLSFTQGAVVELERRLREEVLLPSPAFPNFIGTFDSFVWQFLIAPFGAKGSDARPQLVADVADIAVMPFKGAQPLPLSCFCPDTGIILEKSAALHGFDVSEKPDHQVKAYMKAAMGIRTRLRDRGQLSFEEARRVALQRINDAPVASRIAAALASRFREVIVDEAQDCNPDDLRIVTWLRMSSLRVTVVCDPHQSIYEFRGGVTDELLTFAESFAKDERKTLNGNFRQHPTSAKPPRVYVHPRLVRCQIRP